MKPCHLLLTAALIAAPAYAQSGSPLDHPNRTDDPADVSPAQPSIPARTFNLKDFGAHGDNGATNSTAAFKSAVAAVEQAGGGTLVVPAATGAYFTGPFDLCSNIDFHLDKGAKILFSPKFDDYKGEGAETRGYRPMILIRGRHDVLISGSGTIDGNGEAWWPEARRFKAEANARHASGNTSPRPVMVSFVDCQRIRVEGITLTNASVFNLVQNDCTDVTCTGLTILNPEIAPNTDGIDPKGCQRVLISHCHIDTGDDNVALGGGGMLEKDILITDCQFFHGHGCSIGSGTVGGVENLVVRRCSFEGTDTGVRLKSARGRGGLTQNITYEDLTMKDVGVAVSISSYYDNTPIDASLSRSAEAPAAAPGRSGRIPEWKNILVRDVTAVSCRKAGGLIAGLAEAPIQGVTLQDVSIQAPTGLHVACTRGITLRNVTITPASGPDLVADSTVSGLARTP